VRPTFGKVSGSSKRLQEQAIERCVSHRVKLKSREIDSGVPLCQQIEVSLEESGGGGCQRGYAKSV
jgi:hypothetical protein